MCISISQLVRNIGIAVFAGIAIFAGIAVFVGIAGFTQDIFEVLTSWPAGVVNAYLLMHTD